MKHDGTNGSQPQTGPELWDHAKQLIPGGSQLLSKRAEMFAPEQWPAYYEHADGVTVTSVDGREYVDMSSMGVGSCILGYADPDVNERVHDIVEAGSMATLNAPEEVELAETLVEMHPWSEMVRYARTGGESMTIAVRLARAFTGNDTVAFCGYHGWHDWYLAANLETDENLEEHLLPGLSPKGVPDGLEQTSLPFHYNDIDELERIVAEHDLAAVVMEPIRYETPEDGFLDRVRALTEDHDIPLIFDEITSGFRSRVGGIHERFDVEPDMVVYGKAIANGYPMGALVGRRPLMNQAQETFVSSTFWTERIGPVAALATIRKLREENVPAHLRTVGQRLKSEWTDLAAEHGLELSVKGLDPLPSFSFEYEDGGIAERTYFTQEMLDHGYLASNSLYVSYAHRDEHIDDYVTAVSDVFGSLADCLENDTLEDELDGPVAHTKFKRLN